MSPEKKNNLARFFRSEYTRMVSYVRRLIDDTAARDGEDIVQDVITSIFNLGDVSVPFERLSAYIYQSLRNKVTDILRIRKKTEISLDAPSKEEEEFSLYNVLHDIRYDTATIVEKKEIRQRLFEAIESLSDDQKAVILLNEFEGKTFREISDELDEPLGTLLARKSRAIKKIRKELADLKDVVLQ